MAKTFENEIVGDLPESRGNIVFDSELGECGRDKRVKYADQKEVVQIGQTIVSTLETMRTYSLCLPMRSIHILASSSSDPRSRGFPFLPTDPTTP